MLQGSRSVAAALALLACGDFHGSGLGAPDPMPAASEPAPGVSEPAALGGADTPLEPSGSPEPGAGANEQGEPPAGSAEAGGASGVEMERYPAENGLPELDRGAPTSEGGAGKPDPAGPPEEPPSAPAPSPPEAPPPASGGAGGSSGVPDEPGSGGAAGAGGTGVAGDQDEEPGGGGASAGSGNDEGAEDEEPDVDEEPDENAEHDEDEPEPEPDEDDELEGDLQPSFHLAVLGSSTAAGEGASSPERGWVWLLESSLASSAGFTVSNFARGGYTSEELLPSSGVRGNLDEAIADAPDLIVVALAGSNDLSWGTSTEELFARLHILREGARTAGIPLFFLSTAPKDIGESQRERLQDWSLGMEEAFSSCWVPGGDGEHAPCFIDIFSGLASPSLGLAPQYGSGDGIHLNDAGHAAIHRATEAVIRPYVCSVTRCR